jgi:hypothetical protein
MNQELSDLKEKADSLGIEYPKNIGVAKLAEKIEAANKESMATRAKTAEVKNIAKKGLPKGVKLTDVQIRTALALEPLKVRITNNNPDNKGATTVVAGLLNMHINLQRAVPLNIPIALERCLVEQIKLRTYSAGIPEVTRDGVHTGNFKVEEHPEYNIAYLD